jgi:hypothetical protein
VALMRLSDGRPIGRVVKGWLLTHEGQDPAERVDRLIACQKMARFYRARAAGASSVIGRESDVSWPPSDRQIMTQSGPIRAPHAVSIGRLHLRFRPSLQGAR